MSMILKIDNPEIEKRLEHFVRQQKQDIEAVTLEALKKFLNAFQSSQTLHYEKKDPAMHSHSYIPTDVDDADENLADVRPYSHIQDSAKYVHDLRRQTRG